MKSLADKRLKGDYSSTFLTWLDENGKTPLAERLHPLVPDPCWERRMSALLAENLARYLKLEVINLEPTARAGFADIYGRLVLIGGAALPTLKLRLMAWTHEYPWRGVTICPGIMEIAGLLDENVTSSIRYAERLAEALVVIYDDLLTVDEYEEFIRSVERAWSGR